MNQSIAISEDQSDESNIGSDEDDDADIPVSKTNSAVMVDVKSSSTTNNFSSKSTDPSISQSFIAKSNDAGTSRVIALTADITAVKPVESLSVNPLPSHNNIISTPLTSTSSSMISPYGGNPTSRPLQSNYHLTESSPFGKDRSDVTPFNLNHSSHTTMNEPTTVSSPVHLQTPSSSSQSQSSVPPAPVSSMNLVKC